MVKKMDKFVRNKRDEIVALCKKYKVSRVHVLGSVSDCLHETGMRDLDFLVRFDHTDPYGKGLKSPYFDFIVALEDLFEEHADHLLVAVEGDAHDPYMKRMIEQSKELLYAAA
jgi:predicted nucleotidyltransferase